MFIEFFFHSIDLLLWAGIIQKCILYFSHENVQIGMLEMQTETYIN